MAKTALVTGGNRGIGFETARGLAAAGLDVWIGSRNAADGAAAAKEPGVKSVELDVSDQDSINNAIAAIGDVDVLVNNAGILGSGTILDDPSDFERSMNVMVNGPWYLMNAVLAHMQASGYGRIVNLTSGWGSFSDGLEGPGAYGVAKASLNALTLAVSRAVPDNIKVNAMCPGWVHTRMGGPAAPRTPAEGADTAIWLATLGDDGPTGGFFRDRKPIDW